MKKNPIVTVDLIFLVSVCLFTLAMGIWAARPWGGNDAYIRLQDYFALFGAMIWALSPYLAMLSVLWLLSRKNIGLKTFTVCMVVVSGFGLFVLVDAMVLHVDAQGGLVFLFLPMYQWAGLFLFVLIGAAVYRFSPKAAH